MSKAKYSVDIVAICKKNGNSVSAMDTYNIKTEYRAIDLVLKDIVESCGYRPDDMYVNETGTFAIAYCTSDSVDITRQFIVTRK